MKVPTRGETVLVFDECKTEKPFEEYRKAVRASGGRVRRAVGIEALQRHLAVYEPTFIVHLKEASNETV